ncbi:hypothetical protein ABKN59_002190 [Abortiporus biennis]
MLLSSFPVPSLASERTPSYYVLILLMCTRSKNYPLPSNVGAKSTTKRKTADVDLFDVQPTPEKQKTVTFITPKSKKSFSTNSDADADAEHTIKPTIGTRPKGLPYDPRRKMVYGFKLNPTWLTQRTQTLLYKKGRRLWTIHSRYEVEHIYIRGNLLAEAGMLCARDTLVGYKGLTATFAIYWKSNFDSRCVCPSPEVEEAGVQKLKTLLNTKIEPGWFYT